MYVGLIRGEHMLDSQANWIFLNNEYHVSTETAHLANVSMITLHLLAQRGITTKEEIERFLAPNLSDLDRKSTRLNSSHVSISYAVFCFKKKKIMLMYR